MMNELKIKKILAVLALVLSVTTFARDGKVTCTVTSTIKPDDDGQKTLTWDFSPGAANATFLKTQSVQVGDLNITIGMTNFNGEPNYSLRVLDTQKAINKENLPAQPSGQTALSHEYSMAVQELRTVLKSSGALTSTESVSAYSDDKLSVWVSCHFEATPEISISNTFAKPVFTAPVISTGQSCSATSCPADASSIYH